MLPGELRLKALLGVSRNTLRQALEGLADERWLSSTAQGKQRRVQKDRLPPLQPGLGPPSAGHVFVTFSHGGSHHSPGNGGFADASGGARARIAIYFPQHFQSQKARMASQTVGQREPSAAWILHFVTESMQRWFEQQGIPAFLYGSPIRA
jgi:hypothetical protein